MLTRIHSAALVGVNAVEVKIEVHESKGGDAKVFIVGLPDAAVRESTSRVWAAMVNSGFCAPNGNVTVSLAPADLRKEGPGFDLPIGLAMIALKENVDPVIMEESCVVGELGLNGEVRPVRGILAVALEARARGRRRLLVPAAVAAQASVVEGIEIVGVGNLRDAFDFLAGSLEIEPEPNRAAEFFERHSDYGIDFNDVRGQNHVKRAIEVAVAGGHNLLMIGPPGTGKSMLAKRIATIMPRMTEDEAIETTKVHSAGGFLSESLAFIATRPFRSPHHTISDAGLLGGGSNPGPGEVSLAHNGVLFLDELPEFRRSTLEVLRQPLEDGNVTISRASGSMTFPARFMLVAAMNPCPCGYFGDVKRDCRCPPGVVHRYRQRISGPLLDRIDLHVEVPLVEYRDLASGPTGESSADIRGRVEQARQVQRGRFAADPRVQTNSGMTPRLMRRHCVIDAHGEALLEQAMTSLNFSARAHDRILKVARTLADLEGAGDIGPKHLLEAIQYRTLDRNLWG